MHGGGGAVAALKGSVRLRLLAIIIAVMAVLTAGWPLVSHVVSDHRHLVSGTMLKLGTSQHSSATVTVGPGWTMQTGESNPRLIYVINRGPVHMSIAYAALVNNQQIDDLWQGLQQVVRIRHPGASLSPPLPVRTRSGAVGDIGVVRGPDMVGSASVFAGPSRKFAVEMVVEGPRYIAPLNILAAQRIMRSVIFLSARP